MSSAATGSSSSAPFPYLRSVSVTLIRHGQSVDNLRNIWAGQKDSDLTATGLAQVKALGQYFADTHIDEIISSDLKRASQTAHELLTCNRSDPPPLLIKTHSLREQAFGTAEGQNYKDVEAVVAKQTEETRSTPMFPDAETLDAVNARLAIAVRRFIMSKIEALRKSDDGRPYEPHLAIVAHGVAISELLRILMSYHDSEAPQGEPWPHPWLSYKRVRLNNTGWSRLQLSFAVGPPQSTDSSVSQHAGRSADAPPMPIGKPQRRGIFVRFVGEQNHCKHLAHLSMPIRSSVVGIAAGGGTLPQRSDTSETTQAGSSPDTVTPSVSAGPYNAYSADVMNQAVGHSTPLVPAASPKKLRQHQRGLKTHPRDIDFADGTNAIGLSSDLLSQSHSGSRLDARIAPDGRLLKFVSPASIAHSPGSTTEVWKSVCVRVMPMFSGDALKVPIEEINESVTSHIRKTLERGPARASATLAGDLTHLLAMGMLTMSSGVIEASTQTGPKPSLESDVRLLVRVAQCWTTFFNTLPWLEGCFLPLGTNPVLLSLVTGATVRLPNVNAPGTPLASEFPTSSETRTGQPSMLRSQRIDVRKIALSVFRDCVVLVHFDRLHLLLGRIGNLEPMLESAAATGKGRGKTSAAGNPTAMPGRPGINDDINGVLRRLTQMIQVIRSVQSRDDPQLGIEALERALRVGMSTSEGSGEGGRNDKRGSVRGAYLSPFGSSSRGNGAYLGVPAGLGTPGGSGSVGNSADRSHRRGWMAPKSAAKYGVNVTSSPSELQNGISPSASEPLREGGGQMTASGDVSPLQNALPNSSSAIALGLGIGGVGGGAGSGGTGATGASSRQGPSVPFTIRPEKYTPSTRPEVASATSTSGTMSEAEYLSALKRAGEEESIDRRGSGGTSTGTSRAGGFASEALGDDGDGSGLGARSQSVEG